MELAGINAGTPDPEDGIIMRDPGLGEPGGTVHRSGGRIVGGSDYFVTDLNPSLAIETAVTRRNPYTNSGPVLDASERVALSTMIDACTINGACLMGLDDEQGSIEIGKRADFVVLDRNRFEIDPSEISDAQIVLTVFNGEDVYVNPNFYAEVVDYDDYR